MVASSEKEYLLMSSQKDTVDADGRKVIQKASTFCSYRFGVIICCMCAMTIGFAAQASMSSAMVCMLDNNADGFLGNATIKMNVTGNVYVTNDTNSDVTDDNEDWLFSWDKPTQGWILSTYFVGYYLSMLPSGLASSRFGPKRTVVFALFTMSVLQALVIPATRIGLSWLYVDRVLTGIITGFLYAPTFALVAKWAPRFETSILFSVVGMGMELGTMTTFSVSMVACGIDFQGGWPLIFYTLAAMGMFVTLLFIVFVSDSPFNNSFISKKELHYIEAAIPKAEKASMTAVARIPVKAILSSKPVWAILVSQIGSDWLYYMLVNAGPMYLKLVLRLSDFEVNLLTGVPFLFMIPAIFLIGHLCDRLVVSGVVSNTMIRKLSDVICKLVPGALLVVLGFLPERSLYAAFVLNVLTAVAMGFFYVSWLANPVDLSPTFTGFVVVVCEIGAVWVTIVVPILFENVTINGTRQEWQNVFYITAGLQVVTLTFYCIFGSGELQPWATVGQYQKIEQST